MHNAAERAVRGIAVGRKNWTFAGSDSGGRRAAAIYTLIETATCTTQLAGMTVSKTSCDEAWLADILKTWQFD